MRRAEREPRPVALPLPSRHEQGRHLVNVRERDAASEGEDEESPMREVIDTIGAVPGGESPADISGGPGEGTGWGAWHAEQEAAEASEDAAGAAG